MINPLQYIERYPERTKEILRINYKQWLALVEVAEIEEERIKLAQEQKKVRINKKGGGRPKKLKREEELIVDSWEQSRERPKDKEAQKEYYSGKKKQHIFKGQVVTLPLGKDLVDVEVGKEGKASDIN